ncbi:MAG TPA: hexose kinase [Verrucomicrobiota bacterium]|nr:hexose kinase [Verrucomicrobiota bacterium]
MSALILALNPSMDAEWLVDDVLWEEKNNVLSERRWPGGKGINVARWLKYLGGRPLLLLPLGGAPGRQLAAGLRSEKIPSKLIPLKDATRVNVIVTTARGRQMRFNPPGPKLSAAQWRLICETVKKKLRQTGLLILSGSLPPGLPVTAYAQLIRLAHRAGVKTLLDCDGPAFAAALKARPFLVKPNEHELALWRGRPLRNDKQIKRAAMELSRVTGGWVLVSRGAKPGMLLNARLNITHVAGTPRVRVRNTVGAGDALLAAVAHAVLSGAPPADWLAEGVRTGSAATQVAAGQRPVR